MNDQMRIGKYPVWRYALVLAIVMIGLLLMAACGGGQEEESAKSSVKNDAYANWLTIEHGMFRLHISPTSRFASNSDILAEAYNRFLLEIAGILEVDIPRDTIDLFVYAPGPEALKIAGQPTPFHFGHEIHWGGLYPYGYQLTKYMLDKGGYPPGRFKVINEGIPHLLDYSGRNYHDITNRIVNSGVFVSLDLLGKNTIFDSLDYRIKQAESASLCGYLMFNYGVDRLFLIMQSEMDWQPTLERIVQLPFDEIETDWLRFARQESDSANARFEGLPGLKKEMIMDE